jgi:hypothetical protein
MNLRTYLLTALIFFLALQPFQQEDELRISLKRNWGYASGTGKIQGTFTIRTSGSAVLDRVVFYLDEQVLGESNASPFELRFVTDDFPLGVHRLVAEVFTADQRQLRSNTLQVEFVSADEGWGAAGRIILPMLAVIIGAAALAIFIPWVFTRGKVQQLPPGAPRSYGYYGGAICPKCSRPFSRHVYGLNLGTHKFDRCPYCGKWSLVRRASPEQLQAAEAAELTASQADSPLPEATRKKDLQQEIEDSRFEDL